MLLGEISKDLLTRPLTWKEVLGLLFRLTIFGVATYYSIKWVSDALDPTRKQRIHLKKKAERLMKQIGVNGVKLTEHETSIAVHLVDPRDIKITWKDIAGLDNVVTELQNTVILPFQKRHLSRLFQPPRGCQLNHGTGKIGSTALELAMGPDHLEQMKESIKQRHCFGKTLLAKAMAWASGCQFLNLQASTLGDKWYGESQKLTDAVFTLAAKIQPCIIFIDEIDAFLRSHSSIDHEATAMIKAQFMSLWDGLETRSDCQVMVLGASNRLQDVDPAILRRMPATFQISLPTQQQRHDILTLLLAGENLSTAVNLQELADKTGGYSGSDLRELCRDAATYRVRDYCRKQQMRHIARLLQDSRGPAHSRDAEEEEEEEQSLRPLTQLDLLFALDKMKESKEATAPRPKLRKPVLN